MTAAQPPAFMQALTNHSALTHRRFFMSMTDGAALGGTAPRGGVHPTYGNRLAVTGSGSIMQVSVDTGLVCIPHNTAFAGLYNGYNDASVNLTVAAAHATQFRRDLVIAEILDTTAGDGSDLWQLRVVQGANNASAPAPLPTQPGKSILLAIINVDPAITNLTGKVNDSRIYMSSVSTLQCTSTTRPSSPRVGLLTQDTDLNKQLSYYDGTAYRFVADSGWQTYTPATTGFGSGTFTTRTGRYKLLGEKALAVSIVIRMNAAGTGSSNITVGLPTSMTPQRTVQQVVAANYEDNSNGWYAGFGVVLTSGAGAIFDRIRFPTDTTSDLDSLTGADVGASHQFFIQGVVELA